MIADLIKHQERLNHDTLYELRSLLALYPYFQTARLLLLKNLYLLHDPSFDEELRRAALYITDRNVLFQMTEAALYRLTPPPAVRDKVTTVPDDKRTLSLIDSFLEAVPEEKETTDDDSKPTRKPTPADATVDYVAYLLETDAAEAPDDTPKLKGHDLIESFINHDKGKIVLNDDPEYVPPVPSADTNAGNEAEEDYFTETLARIYIKQGKYSKALEIIRRLSLDYPKKNAYFADQIRFLEKLIINSNNK